MQDKEATFDYFTGSEQSEYRTDITLNDLTASTNYDNEQGKIILNAIYNYTDKNRSALVLDVELFDMLKEFDFDETVDIAIGLGIDIPNAGAESDPVSFTLSTYKSDLVDGDIAHALEDQQNAVTHSDLPVTDRFKARPADKINLEKAELEKIFIHPPGTEPVDKEDKAKTTTSFISLTDDIEEEYKIFTDNISEEKQPPINFESGVYRGNHRKYEGASLNTIQREIDILEKRIMERQGVEIGSDEAEEKKGKMQRYGIVGLIALLIAGGMLYGKKKPKDVAPLPFTTSLVNLS